MHETKQYYSIKPCLVCGTSQFRWLTGISRDKNRISCLALIRVLSLKGICGALPHGTRDMWS